MRTEREAGYAAPLDRQRSTARIILGAILIVAGAGWLLDASGLVEFPTAALGPVALIVIGLALVAGARRRHKGGLITLGIILTLILTAASTSPSGFTDGVGRRIQIPSTTAELDDYRLGVGSFTLDLTHIDFPSGSTPISASVGVGELLVVVPGEVDLVVDAKTGAGEIVVLGRKVAAGVGAKVTDLRNEDNEIQERVLHLDLKVGLGPIRVRRGTP